jgi:uncharacterized damage-inducible protein DinB
MRRDPVAEIDFDLDEAVRILARTPRTLHAWLDGLPEAWLLNREGEGTWSPHDVVGHLIHGERTDWVPRVRQILVEGGAEPFEPFDREATLRVSADRHTSDLLREFAELRASNLEAVGALPVEPARLDDPGLHPDLGPVTLRQLLATWVAHDLTHIAQIARVMAKQYRHEVGPWRRYLPLLDRPIGEPEPPTPPL